MRQWDKLNGKQVAVLRRIAEGDDLSSPDVVALRRSARALADRGLVTVRRRDGWRATITDAGRYYLEHGHHPDRPVRVGHGGMSDDRRGEAGDEHASRRG